MWFVSALEKCPGMRSILCLQEATCAGACDGYARMAGHPATTLLHLGPGLANALCNLHNARRASSPILVLVGDMSTWHKDKDPLLNMDIHALATTVSCSVTSITDSTEAVAAIQQAVAAMTVPGAVGESRVATLVCPHDISWQNAATAAATHSSSATQPPTTGTFVSEFQSLHQWC